MGLRKGQTNNRAGKPKGAINRLNKDLRLSISEFLSNNFDQVVNDWKKLSGKDKVNFYRDLLQYEVPKKQAVAVALEFEKLTDDQLEILCNTLIAKENEKKG